MRAGEIQRARGWATLGNDSVASFASRITSRRVKTLAHQLLDRKEELEGRIKLLSNGTFYRMPIKKRKQILEEASNEKLDRWIQ